MKIFAKQGCSRYTAQMRASFPFRQYCLCLAPLALLLCGIKLHIGGDAEVFAYYTAIRKAHPESIFWMRLFSDASNALLYPVYIFFFIKGIRHKKRADLVLACSWLVAQVLVSVLLTRFVKIAIGRPRPMTGGPFEPFSLSWGHQSFPSGHVTEAVGSTLPLAFRFGRVLLPLLLGAFTAAIGFSRLYLGMHHPTDIWGGIVFGSISGYLSWKLFTLPLDAWRRLPRCIQEIPFLRGLFASN